MTGTLCALLLAALPWAGLAAAEPGGIGLLLGKPKLHRGAYQEVLKVLPGGPADLAGLRTDDRITHINNISCRGKTVDEVAALLHGESGTEVIVQVRRIFLHLSYRIKRQPLPAGSYADRLAVKYPERRLCDYLGAHGGLNALSDYSFKCYSGGDYPRRPQNCWFKRRYIRYPGPEQAQEVKDLLTELSDTIQDCPDWIIDLITDPDPRYPDYDFRETRDGKLRIGLGIKAGEPYRLAVSLGPGAPLMAAPPPKPVVDNTPPPDADGWVQAGPDSQKYWFRLRSVAPYSTLQSVNVPPGSPEKKQFYFRNHKDADLAFYASGDAKAVVGYLPGHEPPAPLPATKAAEPDMSPLMSVVFGMQKAQARQEAAYKFMEADAKKSAPPDEHADGYIEGPPIVHSRAWFSVEAQGAYTDGSDIQVPPGSGKTRKLYFRYSDEGWKALQASRKPQAVLKFFRGEAGFTGDNKAAAPAPAPARSAPASTAPAPGSVGLLVGQPEDLPVWVVKLYPGGSAYRGGMATGDHILSVGGVNCRKKTTAEVVALLRGEAGSGVRVVFRRFGLGTYAATLVREVLPPDWTQKLEELEPPFPLCKTIEGPEGILKLPGFDSCRKEGSGQLCVRGPAGEEGLPEIVDRFLELSNSLWRCKWERVRLPGDIYVSWKVGDKILRNERVGTSLELRLAPAAQPAASAPAEPASPAKPRYPTSPTMLSAVASALGSDGYVHGADGNRYSFSGNKEGAYGHPGGIMTRDGRRHTVYFTNPYSAKISGELTEQGKASVIVTRPGAGFTGDSAAAAPAPDPARKSPSAPARRPRNQYSDMIGAGTESVLKALGCERDILVKELQRTSCSNGRILGRAAYLSVYSTDAGRVRELYFALGDEAVPWASVGAFLLEAEKAFGENGRARPAPVADFVLGDEFKNRRNCGTFKLMLNDGVEASQFCTEGDYGAEEPGYGLRFW